MAQAGLRSVAHVARSADLSESYARQISHGLIPSRAVRDRIAALLAVEVNRLWPSLDRSDDQAGLERARSGDGRPSPAEAGE